MRRYLRLNEHDVLLLWLGRLSFFEKAYPQGMFIALQKASQKCGSRLHLPWLVGSLVVIMIRRYQQAARYYAPDVSIHFLDGRIQMLFVVVGPQQIYSYLLLIILKKHLD